MKTSPAPRFMASRHRYANGVAYNPNRYDILVNVGTDREPYYRAFGGALVLKDKAIAFVGPSSISHRAKEIVSCADSYVWGKDLAEALAKIKPAIEAEARTR